MRRAVLLIPGVFLVAPGCLGWFFLKGIVDPGYSDDEWWDSPAWRDSRRFDSDVADSDTDVDADTDTDTDADVDLFEPTWYVVSHLSGRGGGEVGSYALSGERSPPQVELTFFDSSFERECTWVGEALDAARDETSGIEGLYEGHSVRLQLLDTSCGGFNPDVWMDENPTVVVEARTWWLGVGPLTADLEEVLHEAVDNAGLDWERDWAPYVVDGYAGPLGTLAPAELRTSYGMVMTLNEDGEIALDADGQPRWMPSAELTSPLPTSALMLGGLFVLDVATLLDG